jgi:outer membrane protein assembly factor BamB
MRTCLIASLLVLTASPANAEEVWTQFRGPDGAGLSDATGLPMEWSESKHVKWKTQLPGKAWSSPVVWDEQVWVTNATVDGKRLSAVCLDRASGKVLRDLLVFAIAKPQFCYPFNSYASPTPVIEEGRIYVHYGSHGTACLDTATGKKLWTRQDLPCDHHRGAGSSPIVYGNLLVLTFDGFNVQYLVALDKNTGKTVWKHDRQIDYGTTNGDSMKAYGTPAVIEAAGRLQLISPSAGATVAYDPLTGDELWRVRSGGMNAAAPPLFAHGMLLINTADGGFRQFAVRPDGSGDVTETHVEWKEQEAIPSRCAPLVVDDLLFMTTEAGIFSCLEAATGKLVWRQRLGGHYSASPVYADGHIYFSSEDGDYPVVAATREYTLLATNQLEAGSMASPAIAGKAIFLRTKTHLYRIEE